MRAVGLRPDNRKVIDPEVPHGVVAEYLFKDGVVDTSGEQNNGTNTSITFAEDPVHGSVAVFNGTAKAVTTSSSVLNPSSVMSISCWVKFTDVSVYQSMVARDGTNLRCYSLELSNTLGMVFGVFQSNGTYIPAYASLPVVGTWYHLVGVADGTNITLYLNGVAGTPSTYDGTIAQKTTATVIGNRDSTPAPLHGSLSKLRIFNRALSQSEIDNLYNKGEGI